MNTKRTIAITLVFLMTASAVGTLSVSAVAVAPTKLTQLTIASTDLYPSVTEPITLYGRLMNGTASVQGQTITLTYSTDNGQTWNPLGTCVTNYYGGYSYTTTPTQLPLLDYLGGSNGYSAYLIQATFAGNAPYAPSSSSKPEVDVWPIYQDVSIQTNVAAPVTNQPFTISGQVWNDHTGKAIASTTVYGVVYLFDPSGSYYEGQYDLGQVTTNANGVYRFTQVQLPAGVVWISVWVDEDFNHGSGGNSIAPFTINTAPTQLSIASGTTNPAAYKPFTVYGLLTNAVTGARLPNEGGLTLTYYNGGGWNTLPGSVSTNANGQYAFSLTLPAGYYLIKVHFPGDLPNYYPSDNQQQPWTIYVS